MNIHELRPYIIGFIIGAMLIGGGVYILMDQKVQVEQKRLEIAEQLLNDFVEEIPTPPAPPTIE